MAMQSEQHGNAFAKLNYGNPSDSAAPDGGQAGKLTSSLAAWQTCMAYVALLRTIGAAASWLSLD
jgi:hypothetical protein